MCQKRSTTRVKVNGKIVRVDACLKDLIPFIDRIYHTYELLACCCGHGRYPMTIVGKVRSSGAVKEILSGTDIPRTRNFYKTDSDGYYYIPEVVSQDPKS